MKKTISIFLIMVLFSVPTMSSFAYTTIEDNNLTEENIVILLQKYGLEIESTGTLSNNNQQNNILSIEQLEELIINELNTPNIIEMNDIHIRGRKANNLSESFEIKSTTATEFYYSKVYNDLLIGYSVSGKYINSKEDALWIEATGSSVWEESSNEWSELKKVISSSAELTHSGKRITQKYEFEVQNYLKIPIPGADKYLRVKSGSPTVKGTIYYYAKNINS